MDKVDSSGLEPVFDDFFAVLQRGKHLEQYRFLGDHYLVCLDGTDKQDCETKAGKRLLKKIRKSHSKLKIIIVGDSLYSKQPFIEEIKADRMNYILAAKPDDHKILMEWVNESRKLSGLKEVSRMECRDKKGRLYVYEWINEVPLNGNKETVMTNYFEYQLMDNEKVGYHNSWVTDIPINEQNIRELVRGGRCRWKIENETFNTLKNQGYHIEHNFGHGKKNLSMNFFLLNLLAFSCVFKFTENRIIGKRYSHFLKGKLLDLFYLVIRSSKWFTENCCRSSITL